MQRATAVTAIAGLVLTLAPTSLSRPLEWWQGVILVTALATSVAAIALSVAVQHPHKTQAPSVKQLREHWRRYLDGEKRDLIAQVAEDLVRSASPAELSAAEFAKGEADSRVKRLKYAYWAVTAALIAVGLLTVTAALRGEPT